MTRDAAKLVDPAAPRSRESRTIEAELERLVFPGGDAAVYERYTALPEEEQRACRSIELLSAVVRAGIARLWSSGTVQPSGGAAGPEGGQGDIEQELDRLIRHGSSRNDAPRQLFECLLAYGDALAEKSDTDRALRCFDRAEALGIRSHPDLLARLTLKRAELLLLAGRVRTAHGILSVMVKRYYLVPDRNLIA